MQDFQSSAKIMHFVNFFEALITQLHRILIGGRGAFKNILGGLVLPQYCQGVDKNYICFRGGGTQLEP